MSHFTVFEAKDRCVCMCVCVCVREIILGFKPYQLRIKHAINETNAYFSNSLIQINNTFYIIPLAVSGRFSHLSIRARHCRKILQV